MKLLVLGMLILTVMQVRAWNDGLWGREVKRPNQRVSNEMLKMAEEMVRQNLQGRKAKLARYTDSSVNEDSNDVQ